MYKYSYLYPDFKSKRKERERFHPVLAPTERDEKERDRNGNRRTKRINNKEPDISRSVFFLFFQLLDQQKRRERWSMVDNLSSFVALDLHRSPLLVVVDHGFQ